MRRNIYITRRDTREKKIEKGRDGKKKKNEKRWSGRGIREEEFDFIFNFPKEITLVASTFIQ